MCQSLGSLTLYDVSWFENQGQVAAANVSEQVWQALSGEIKEYQVDGSVYRDTVMFNNVFQDQKVSGVNVLGIANVSGPVIVN